MRLAQELGLARLGKLSIDGTKVRDVTRASARLMSYDRMQEEEKRLEGEIAALLEQADAVDAAEDASLWARRYQAKQDGGGDHGLRQGVGVQQAQRRGGPDLPGVGARHRGAPPPPRRATCRGDCRPWSSPGYRVKGPGWELHCKATEHRLQAVAHHRRGTAARQGAGGL